MNIQPILKELAVLGVTTLTQESIKQYVNTRIKPIFVNWGEETRSIELEECISEYLLKCYTKNIIMNTIVFGRLQKTLDDLYIPLTLEEYRNIKKKWIINETCYDILDAYNRVLIIDKAGMGKSTIVKFFACQGINLDKCIPIVIELRKLDANQSILEFIKKQLSSFDKSIEIEDIVQMLNKGEFVIFFDGYDEVSNDNKAFILDQIQEFVGNSRKTKMVITSRDEDDLNSLGEFKCVNVKPLEKEEAYALIKKYDNYGKISEKLIERIEKEAAFKVLHEFLTNPLLVSLLYKTFEYKEEIPYKKIDFYDQVYAALFNDHDKTKGSAYAHEKKTKLDRFQFEKILRAFGFLSLKYGKVEYSSQEIYHLLEQAVSRFSWLKINISEFLHDITHAVPFIQKDGTGYRWVHKSFMEYFASCFICLDNKEFEQKYLEKMLFQNGYEQILDFCHDIDVLGYRKYVIMPFLTQFINRYDKCFIHEFFRDYDQEYIEKAKRLIAIDEYLVFILFDDKIDTAIQEIAGSCAIALGKSNSVGLSAGAIENKDKLDVVLARSRRIYFLYMLFEQIPQIFDKMHRAKNLYTEIPNCIPLNQPIVFDDDIDNLIYSNKDFFYKIVDVFYDAVFPLNLFINYDSCKELIKVIEAENINNNSSLFEL